MATPRALGVRLLGVWLVIWGLNVLLPVAHLLTLLALFAIVAGLLILAGR